MDIMIAQPEQFTGPCRYFIDCPHDAEFCEPSVRRIEIPRALAKYIYELQQENKRLKAELETVT